MVVGYWGKTSTDLDIIVGAITEPRVLYLSSVQGERLAHMQSLHWANITGH